MQLLAGQHRPQVLPHLPVEHAVEQEDEEALKEEGWSAAAVAVLPALLFH